LSFVKLYNSQSLFCLLLLSLGSDQLYFRKI